MRREKPKQAVFLLLAELLRSDRLPPVTLALIGLNAVIYLELFDFNYPSLLNICLSAHQIINRKEWYRLILAQFFHGDDWHLYYNMISLSIKGRSLERKYGSRYFLILLAVFTLMISVVYVSIQYISYLTYDRESLTSCAVGFSGVLFALKVLTTHNLPDGTVHALNFIPVPSKYAYWAELIIIQLLTPNVSFVGHLAGIVVGLLYVYGPLKYILDKIVPREFRRQNNRVDDNNYGGTNYGGRFGHQYGFNNYGSSNYGWRY